MYSSMRPLARPCTRIADLSQPLDRVHDFQDGLCDVDLESKIGGHHVGKASRVFQVFNHDHHVRNQHLAEADDFFDLFLDGAHDRLGLQCGAGLLRLDEFFDFDGVVGVVLNVFLDAALGEALYQDLDTLIGQFEHPHDDAHRTDRMNILRLRIFHVQGFLSREEQHQVPGQRRLDCLDGHFAADE